MRNEIISKSTKSTGLWGQLYKVDRANVLRAYLTAPQWMLEQEIQRRLHEYAFNEQELQERLNANKQQKEKEKKEKEMKGKARYARKKQVSRLVKSVGSNKHSLVNGLKESLTETG